jgi:plasmid stabilization system protein ParE
MKIRWTTEATDNLEHIQRHIEEDNSEAAHKNGPRHFRAHQEPFRFSQPWPHRAQGRDARISAFSVTYFVAYRVQDSTVEILYIRHGAQQQRD